MTIKNKHLIGQTVWFEGYRDKLTTGVVDRITRVGDKLSYSLEAVLFNFTEDQLFKSKREYDNARCED